MHEEAVLRDLRRKILEVARAESDRPIVRVRLWVGALSHLTPVTLRARWPEVVADSPARDGTLEVEVSGDPLHPDALAVRIVDVTVVDPPPAEARGH